VGQSAGLCGGQLTGRGDGLVWALAHAVELAHDVPVGVERQGRCVAELRLWLRGQRASPFELGFDDTLLFLVDEMEMFSGAELVGKVLTDDSEPIAFEALASAVTSLIEAIGRRGSFAEAVASGTPWELCVTRAHELQRRLNSATGPTPPTAPSP
jgi:hypothetical protein